MPPIPDLHFDFEWQEDRLLVTASGTLAFESALRLLKHMCDIAAGKKVNKILLNVLALSGELSTLDRYTLGLEIAAYLKQLENPKVAFVGKPPAMDRFVVLVAQNRGVNAEIFSSPGEALRWLG